MQELLLGALAGFVLSLLGNLWLSRNRTQTIDKLAVKVEDMLETVTRQETRIDSNCSKIDSLNKDVTSLNATYQFLRETMAEINTSGKLSLIAWVKVAPRNASEATRKIEPTAQRRLS